MTSTYWGALTVGRLLAVPIAAYVPPATFIAVDLLGACLAAGVFLLVGTPAAPVVSAVSVAMGLSLASIFASTLAVAETRMPFTGRRASLCIAGASTGEVVLPLLIGALFDRFGVAYLWAGNGLLKGIEVNADQVDRLDTMQLHRLLVIRIISHREQPTVDFGVQRLDPAVHHFWDTCDLLNRLDGNP